MERYSISLSPIVLPSRPFSLGDPCDLGYAMPQVRLRLHITGRTAPSGPGLGATPPDISISPGALRGDEKEIIWEKGGHLG